MSPVRRGLHRNGLWARTFFYPGTLLPIEHEQLPSRAGYLGKSLDDLRAALRVALGIGQGSCLAPGAVAGSRRGRVVTLSPGLARDIETSFAVVLTEARYSRENNYQIILPIYPEHGEAPGKHDLIVSARDWFRVLPMQVQSVLLPIPTTHSIWHDDDIDRETASVVDEESLAQIDRRLCAYFSLPPLADGIAAE